MSLVSDDANETANIWYRMGKIYQADGAYAPALDCYYHSESHAEIEDLSPEIARRTAECLESLGKFAALRYELSERVSMDEGASQQGAEIVAEIGSQKISKAQLDREIERQIDLQISRFASYLPQDQQNQQKEALFKQLSAVQERMKFLSQMVAQEVLYRKAREENLVDDAETRELIREAEKTILTQRIIEKELSDQIKIGASDVQTFFEANKADYMAPDRARISHILLSDETQAGEVLSRLKNGEDFAKLANQLSLDDATKSQAGEIQKWVQKGEPIVELGHSGDVDALIFNTQAGNTCDGLVQTELGFHVFKVLEREPARQRSFDEVQNDVYRELRSRKEREVQEQLLETLNETYDVVIHHEVFMREAQSANDGQQGQNPKP